jgi:hypothetical protein
MARSRRMNGEGSPDSLRGNQGFFVGGARDSPRGRERRLSTERYRHILCAATESGSSAGCEIVIGPHQHSAVRLPECVHFDDAAETKVV